MRSQEPAESSLDHSALGPFAVTVQSVSFVGPAFSGLFLFPVIAIFAGVSVALAFLIAGAIILMLAVSLGTLAERLPSAGGYFTYVTRAIGERAGLLVGWIFLIYAPISPGFIVAYTAHVCVDALGAEYGVQIPWWSVFVVAVLFVTAVVYSGIRLSTKWLIGLGLIEVTVVLGLALWGFADPGPGGFSFDPISPSAGPGLEGIYLGVVFSLFAYAGWEGSVPLAEESRRPRRSVPLGLVCAVLFLVALFVFTSWGLMIGWGTDALPSLLSSEQAPPFVLAQSWWGDGWVLVLLALLNSVVCASIASFGTVSRMWFAMARSGLGPARLARLSPRTRVPGNAVLTQGALTLAVGLLFGLWLGPEAAFHTLILVATLAGIALYLSGNLAVMLLARRERRATERAFACIVFPVVTSAAVLWVGYKSLDPLPPAPERYGALAAFAWMVIGAAVAIVAHRRGTGSWSADARLGLEERMALEVASEPGAAGAGSADPGG
jgi:amino acid transporter